MVNDSLVWFVGIMFPSSILVMIFGAIDFEPKQKSDQKA